LALSLTAGIAAAQSAKQDYVVTTAGDTLRGYIQTENKYMQLVRLHRPGVARAKFDATQVSSYGTAAGPMGVSRIVGAHGTSQFMVPLVQGHVNLYSGKNEQGDKRYFLQPADSAYVIEVAPSTARLIFHRLLSGCSSLDFSNDETARQYPYTYSGMTRLIMNYNACQQPNQPSKVIKPSTGWHASLGVKAGVNKSDFALYADDYASTHTQAYGYQAGAFLHIVTRTNFSMQLEATYLALRSYYGPIATNTGTSLYTANSAISLAYSQLQLPFLIRYTIGHGTLRPYVNTGPSYGVNFNGRSALIYQRSDRSSSDKQSLGRPELGSLGWTAGAGFLIVRPSFPTLSVEARFDRLGDYFDNLEYYTYHRSLRLDLGITF